MDRFVALQAFVLVADEGSFTAAASRLGITKSVISKQISGLERHLGVRLLNRTTRRLSLTEAGARFYERSVGILDDLSEAERAVSDLNASPRGLLRVNVPVSFAHLHLGPALPDFLERHPDLEVEVTLNDRFVDLINEGYDLAIRIAALWDSSLIARRIAPCESWVCAAPHYLERHGEPATPQQLAGHNWLIYTHARSTREWRVTGPDGRAQQIPMRGNLRINNGECLMAAAIHGFGVLLVPDFIAWQAVRDRRLVRLFPECGTPELSINAVYPYTRHVSAKVRAFVDFLLERFGTEPPAWAWERVRPDRP